MRILICTDGYPAAEEAASLVSRLNFSPETVFTLLGVSESDGDQARLSASFERVVTILDKWRTRVDSKLRYGHTSEQIAQETTDIQYDLVAVGARSHHRALINQKTGPTVHRLARYIQSPLLVGRNIPEKVNKVLMCTAGEEASLTSIRHAGRLLAGVQPQICLLHVMSQLAMRLDSVEEDLLDTADSAMQRGTREGLHLQRAMQALGEAGLADLAKPLIRHGLVVEEVLAELNTGNYDLLMVGAHYSPKQSRWMGILLEDIADQLMTLAPCSVLIA